MYELESRPRFVSNMRPKAVIGDHGDELFSVFESPLLKGNVSLLPVCLAMGGPDMGPSLVALCGDCVWISHMSMGDKGSQHMESDY